MNDFNLSSIEKHTPMMQQYLEIKAQAKDLILLYRLGDFYEMFFDDAIQASKLLNLTLTKRGFFNNKPIPMAGIPAISLDQYLAKFLDQGQSIAICEQIGEININNKGPIERKIVKIITPGTLTDDFLLPTKSDRIVLSIHNTKHSTGISYLNLANGEFYVLECEPHELETEIHRLDPAEILISENDKLNFSYKAKISKIASINFNIDNAMQELLNHFKINSINCFDIQNMKNAVCAAGALIKYVIQTQFTDLKHIKNIKIENNNEYVILNPETRKNLELTTSINGNNSTLFTIMDNCSTSMGSRTLKRWLQNPIRNIQILRKRQEAIDTLYQYICQNNKNQNFLKELRSFPDLERISSRISMKSAKPKEISSLRDAISLLPIISEQLINLNLTKKSSLIKSINNCFYIDNDLLILLNKSIVTEPSNNLKDGNIILSGFDQELDKLRDIYLNSHMHLSKIEEIEKKNTGINNLKIEFNRINGFYIEVSKGQIYKIPKHYVRKQTLKNTERYITEELKNLENTILASKDQAIRREKLLYENLLSEIDKYYDELSNCAKSLAQLDVLLNLAIHAYNNNWNLPIISEDNEIIIKDGRHPVVENNIECFIPNSCELKNDANRIYIITGPNMGGKSTYMRQVALITILAKIGSFIPAKTAIIGNIDRIFTRIGANDDISHNKSTFMVEMTEAALILNTSTKNSLVLMDEIGRGTSTYDGLSLAWSIVITLLTVNKSLTLFSTHYFELTEITKKYSHITNVHLTISEESDNITFLHEVKKGICNKSYGIHVAKTAGIPQEVINIATKKLKYLENKKNNATYKSIINNIINLKLDDITGLEALNILNNFKIQIKNINKKI
ncbi:DNA mismatch repair protein MutS [Candidatus Kinetoplastibacterium sorsogonicusi]|uniref:DNA mismatch repair protein MutS n=1 Tax=Candidatus Kinetoplastidibacterium kentomonadis TaxID=1576550 RepID=A0A3S7J9E6_9PROT|nr:DNA mismatch repair protein MutS [Candidatus Kinetoplastibacterium sorsogonicusi]AWD32290.1 DNA mismatch repair protein MutS [Candidatus Kinetoplastibacterium sorsogonicusi]